MGTQQYFDIVQTCHLVVVYGDEPHLTQTVAFHTIMYNIAQAVERAPFGQFLLGFLDGSGHSEAETAATIYFYL